MNERVGMIGVGLMGHGIAKNIALKGWGLRYLRHPGNQPTDDLDRAGAKGCDTAAELAGASDILVLCVTGTPQVEDVLLGSGRVLEALRPGMVVVDCSTANPTSTVSLAAKVVEKGAHFVDAAMTRTPKEAEEGRLNLLVGGEPEVVAQVRPLLSAFSENIFEAGGVGTGHQLKLLHNFVSLGSVTLIAEAVACAGKGGVSMDALVECLAKGGGGGVALERLRPYIEVGETAQLRFSIANAAKDLSYYRRLAEDLGAADLVAEGVSRTLEGLVGRGEGQAFVPEAVRLLQD
ncbi:3-hydroxyisobutyrate dehydrogenase [Mesorhizobium australicum]|uniref:3-hydroxyisobutyrate dehydrogenase n=2 Tax=Mesorhizobium australicum TaxID=536018 RepID=A0A1X7NZF4_9HYPH|nr:3-hydroxyisobutyrate dehydrogenase [Mesorhizobium australicum]